MPECPRCGHCFEADTAALVDDLRARCHGLGIAVGIGDTITERDLARLLGVSDRTARAWRELHSAIPFRKLGRRILYALPAVAEYLARDRQ